MRPITPCLWFDHQAEEAVDFYVSLFPNSKVDAVTRYGAEIAEAMGRPAGTVLTISFTLNNQSFLAINCGPHFRITEAVSLVVECRDQDELDGYWGALAEGGSVQQGGWLRDRFGVSWQIVPESLRAMVCDPNPLKSQRVIAHIMETRKLSIKGLEEAYAGKALIEHVEYVAK